MSSRPCTSLSGTSQAGPSAGFAGALHIESTDPDALVAWLQGRSEVAYRSQKPLRLSGNVRVAGNRIAIEAMKAEIDGGAVEGRVAVSNQPAGGSRFEGELKAERLDLDAATAFVRSLVGPIRGKGEFQVDGETIPVAEGSVVSVAPNGSRCWRSLPDEPLYFIVIQAPAGQYKSGVSITDGIAVNEPVTWPSAA